jgi:hypothetical protein
MNPADNNSPPAATLMYNFLLAFPDYPDVMPAVLTFQRSSIKIGRKFMTKLKTVRTPLFGSIFTLSASDDKNGAGQEFKNISMIGAGLVQDPDMYDSYKALHLSLSKTGLNIRDIDSLQGDADATEAGEPASNCTASAASPSGCATACAMSANRSATATRAPSATNRRTTADPIPPPPPVTIATLPCSRPMGIILR